MSQALVRETNLAEEPLARRLTSPLAPDEKNYLTPAGAHRLREALAELKHERIEWAAQPDSDEAKKELEELDQHVHYLEESLRTAEIVPVPPKPWDLVRFGAIVVVRDTGGEESQLHIVGVDEADLLPDSVSWRSPLARALLHARLGQRVNVERSGKHTDVEIVSISYE